MMHNTKERSLEIQTTAAALLEDKQVDVKERVDTRPLAKELAKLTGCHYDTAKRHIAKAVRRARGEIIKGHSNWGGSREGAGYPKGQPRSQE